MLSFPAMLYHAVIWIIVFVSTNGQGIGNLPGRSLLQMSRARFTPSIGQAGRGAPTWFQRISAMRNRRTQGLNATQQSTGNGVSTPTTAPTLVPSIPRLPRRLLGRWNRRRFQNTTTNPDATTTTTISSLRAARQRQVAERKLQRRMFRRQRLQAREKRLQENIKAKTENSSPSPPSSPLQNMLTTDVAAGELKNSTNSSDSSSKSQLSSWEQQKRKMIGNFRKKQVELDARIAAAKRAIEIVKLREIRKDLAQNQTVSLIDSINANINSQINLTNSDGSMSNASLPQFNNVNNLTEASSTSPNTVPLITTHTMIETTSTPLVNHSNARLGLESALHQTHSIANIGDPLVPGMELGPGEGIPLGIPVSFVPVDINTFLSDVVAKPGATDTKDLLSSDQRNSLQTEDKTLAQFWPPRLAITSNVNKGQPLLGIENETPIAGHRSGIPLGSSRRVGIKDINHFGEPLGLSKSDSPPPIQRTEFINSILGGLRQHILFHRNHHEHGSSEPLNIDLLGEQLKPLIGHSGEPLEPTIGNPGDQLQPSFGHSGEPMPPLIGHSGAPLPPLFGHSGEPMPPSIGHPGEPLQPLIGDSGEPFQPSIGHPGEPLPPLIGNPGEPLHPSIGHPGEPVGPLIGHPGEPLGPLIGNPDKPLSPSIDHLGEQLPPLVGNIPARETFGNQPVTDTLEPSSSSLNEGVPLQSSLGQPLGESNQGEPIGLGPIGGTQGSEPENEWADISFGASQPVTQFQDVDLSTSFASDEPTSSSSLGQGQGGIQTLNGGFIPRIERPPESTSSVSGAEIRTQTSQLSQIFSGISSNLRRP
ncbi:uncharacterized protein LOC128232336 isoform X1 [Mya arenaria]|uniref:uncharacterized protein LOC128232336 isoform X1 n=1 Tax=Mya arenaria TaxID=6604 RepID=UPI0022E196F3|nr:uncharacterized protein LOC128232336 isoform X1 [Mya arenaria]